MFFVYKYVIASHDLPAGRQECCGNLLHHFMLKLPCMKYLVPFWTMLFLLAVFFPLSVRAASVGPINFVGPSTGCGADEVNTALGCISTSVETGSNSFFTSVIKIAVGLGGGLALILMLFGVFIITTSAGIPDKLKEGPEIITSAISGLIFIILSVFLLRLIGVDILGLPGLK